MAKTEGTTEKPRALLPNELGYESPYEFCSKCDRYVTPDEHQCFQNHSCHYRGRKMDKPIVPFLW